MRNVLELIILLAPLVSGATCVWDTAQCGGKNYTGLKNCCSSKSVCTKINDYYSKCIPATSSCTNKLDSQCGGKDFKGTTCCPSGLKCTYRNEWFSKCMSGAPTPTTSPSCSNKLDSQCGGVDFKGTTCCPSGLKCTYRNEWFSKCMSGSPTPTTKPTTSKPTSSSCSNKLDSQCGGVDFKGNTCCPSGLKCTYRNEWFSKCMAATTPTASPTTAKPSSGTTSKPTSASSGSCKEGIQCTLDTYNNKYNVCIPSTCGKCGTGTCDGIKDECCVQKVVSPTTASDQPPKFTPVCSTSSPPCILSATLDDTTVCDPSPCVNGAACAVVYEGGGSSGVTTAKAKCLCDSKHSGFKCEITCSTGQTPCGADWGGYADYFYSANDRCCATDAECFIITGKYDYGSVCASLSRPKSCTPDPCKNGGTCGEANYYGSGGLLYCYCPAGYAGLYCEKPPTVTCASGTTICGYTNDYVGGSPGTTCCPSGKVCGYATDYQKRVCTDPSR